MVVIAGIERDPIECAGGNDAAQHIERAVAVERRDLDGDDIVDRGKAPPELSAQDHAADRGLQIEADQRNLARHRPQCAMISSSQADFIAARLSRPA